MSKLTADEKRKLNAADLSPLGAVQSMLHDIAWPTYERDARLIGYIGARAADFPEASPIRMCVFNNLKAPETWKTPTKQEMAAMLASEGRTGDKFGPFDLAEYRFQALAKKCESKK